MFWSAHVTGFDPHGEPIVELRDQGGLAPNQENWEKLRAAIDTYYRTVSTKEIVSSNVRRLKELGMLDQVTEAAILGDIIYLPKKGEKTYEF
jgi:methionyl-tRNA synthetase